MSSKEIYKDKLVAVAIKAFDVSFKRLIAKKGRAVRKSTNYVKEYEEKLIQDKIDAIISAPEKAS